jgi:hypothetical protein
MAITDERRSELLNLVNPADCLAFLLAEPGRSIEEAARLSEIVLGHHSAADRVKALDDAGLL